MKILHWFNNLKVLRVDASQAATNEFLYKKARKELDVCRKILIDILHALKNADSYC